MAEYNSMQANLGLIPGTSSPSGTKSPAQVASELSQQASMQMQYAQAMLPMTSSRAASFTFGQQFQQQLQQIQSQQSFNPYQASALSMLTMPSVLPSPLLMTPASSGVFRPAAPSPMGAPMSPMPIMPAVMTPFTPRMPSPMFQNAWEQELQQREMRADSLYSMVAQAPRVGGAMGGYAAGAMAGAAAGSRLGFGRMGAMGGALLGAAAAGSSGFSGAMGDLAMIPMRPNMEMHQMGAALQRQTQDWVVQGPQMHQMGRGLSRSASMELAGGIQSLAMDSGFQKSTNNMFNRNDLMKITQLSGQSGLMDMEQGVEGIRGNLREVSQVVKRFMELTNDPDVVSVIKQMGQLRRFGLSLPEMDQAAAGMRSYARGAGTTISGLVQGGGLPGAMTYQQAGLSAGAGFNYGNFSMASARQSVASGTFSEAQLSMLGGVSGVSQRNMQAQAAFMSMPMLGASFAGYNAQSGSWGPNMGNIAGQMKSANPIDMIMGAYQNLGQGVAQGGVGALAMLPLQQRSINDAAARAMSPTQQTIMRYQMALNTGKSMGLEGANAFAAGSRMLYGDEMSEQMLQEVSNPDQWKSLQGMSRRRVTDIAQEQYGRNKEERTGFFGKAFGPLGKFPEIGISLKTGIGDMWQSWQDSREESNALDNGQFLRIGRGQAKVDFSSKEAMSNYMRNLSEARAGRSETRSSVGMSAKEFARVNDRYITGGEEGGLLDASLGAVANLASFFIPGKAGVAAAVGTSAYDLSDAMQSGRGMSLRSYYGATQAAEAESYGREMRQSDSAFFAKGLSASLVGADATASYQLFEKESKVRGGGGFNIAQRAGNKIASLANKYATTLGGSQKITKSDAVNATIEALAEESGISKAAATKQYNSMSDAARSAIETQGLAFGYSVGTVDAKGGILDAQKETNAGIKEEIWANSDADLDKLKSNFKQAERDIGLIGTYTDQWGEKRDFEKPGQGEFEDIAKYASKEEMLALSLAHGGLGQAEARKVEDEITRVLRARDPKATDAQIQERAQKVRASVALGDIGGKVGVVSDKVKTLLGGMGKSTGEAVIKAMSGDISSGGLEMGSREFEARGLEDLGVTADWLTNKDAKGTLEALNKSGNKAVTEKWKKWREATGPEKARLADELKNDNIKSGMQALGVASELTTATGDEARAAERDASAASGAAGEFGDIFKYFNADTTSQFANGAKMLYDAMLMKSAFGD